jgi:hypothetical protein
MGAWRLSLPHPAATGSLTFRLSKEGFRLKSKVLEIALVLVLDCPKNLALVST